MADKRVGLEVDINSESVGTYEKKVTSAVGQLRKMKQELAGMDSGSPAFKKLAIDAAKLEDKIGDVRNEIKTLASDTFKIDAVVDIGRTIAGGFAAAQGAIGLFAGENEDLQKALLKTQSAMTLLMGVQELSNFITGQSAGKLALVSAGQKAYTIAVGTSTGVLKAFRIALASTGIGLIVVAIGALIANWDKLTGAVKMYIGSSDDSRTSIEKVNDAMEAQNRIITAKRKLMDAEFDLQEESLEKQIAIADERLKRELHDINVTPLMRAERALMEEAAILKHQKAIDDIHKKGGDALAKELEKEQADNLKSSEARKKIEEETQENRRKDSENFQNYVKSIKDAREKTDDDELMAEVDAQERQHLADQKFREDRNKEFAIRLADAKTQGEAFLAQQHRINEKSLKDEQDIHDAKLSIATSGVMGLTALAEIMGKEGEKQTDFQKGLAITQIAIDTASAISSVIAGAAKASKAGGPAAPYLLVAYIASGVATVLANIAAAKKILGDSGPTPSLAPSASVPNMSAAAPQLQGSSTGTLADDTGAESMRVYVVESDITRTQGKVRRIERKATIK